MLPILVDHGFFVTLRSAALPNFVLVYYDGEFSRSTPEHPGLPKLISFICGRCRFAKEAVQQAMIMNEDLIGATLVKGWRMAREGVMQKPQKPQKPSRMEYVMICRTKAKYCYFSSDPNNRHTGLLVRDLGE